VRIIDLGELSGDLLLFGGVYSNLHALEALIACAGQQGIPPGNAICTGDIVAYCADAAGSVARLRDWGCPVLKGNCEAQLAADASDCGCGYDDGSQCSILSRSWYAHALATVPAEAKAWMGRLPDRIVFRHNGLRYAVVHGGASDISKFLWPVTPKNILRREIKILEGEVGAVNRVVSGHSGIAFQADVDGVTWINAGAVGLPPNAGRSDTNFVFVSDKLIENKYLNYDIHAQVQAMRRAGLVQGYHETLSTGYWPSDDTLPPEMRRT
jgi:predicted phosphodiesterase